MTAHKCSQENTIKEIQKDFLEVRESSILQNEKIKNMLEQNNKEHWEIMIILKELSIKFDNLPKSFVTRLEFKAIAWAIGIVSIALGIIATVRSFMS